MLHDKQSKYTACRTFIYIDCKTLNIHWQALTCSSGFGFLFTFTYCWWFMVQRQNEEDFGQQSFIYLANPAHRIQQHEARGSVNLSVGWSIMSVKHVNVC